MKAFLCLAALGILTILTACGAPPSPTPPARPPVLRLELPTDPDISDLPRLMAADSLREMGYTVQPIDFGDNALSVQALVQGDLDAGFISIPTAWTAIQKGAKIATIVDDVADTRVLAVAPTINTCSDLAGKRIAIPGLTSAQALVLNHYLKTQCGGITYEPIVISSQTNRLIALTTNQVEGSVNGFANVREIEREQKTPIKILVHFADVYPGLRGATIVASQDLRTKYPETVKDLIRAQLLARRKIQDPKALSEQIVKYLKLEPAEADDAAKTYLELTVWDLNGGFTTQVVQNNIDFYTETGGLPAGLKPTDVADLSFLNAVLDEIGRK